MKAYLRIIFILTLICLVCAALLATVQRITAAPIEEARKARETAAIRSVLPAAMTNVVAIEVAGVTNFVVRQADGSLAAAAIKGKSTQGYGGDIALLVGFVADGSLHNFEVLAASETPGLGARIDSDEFKDTIRGRAAGTNWKVTKDGGDIDAITAATISSRAALDAIEDASAKFKVLINTLQKGTNATL